MGLNSEWANLPDIRKRFLIFSLAATAIFLLLVLRLWNLQVISTERYQTLSEKNRIRYVSIAAPRGPIYDRDGALLVDNRPAFAISVLRQEVDDRSQLLERLSEYLSMEPQALLQRWEAGRRFPRFRPLPLAEDVGRDALERVQENSVNLPGVLAEVRPLRAYPHGETASHLLGYLGEITEEELQDSQFAEYRAGEFIGKSGLEKKLENFLRGAEGERRVEVDVMGRELRLLKTQDPVPGNRVFLTIDLDVQRAAEEAFGTQAGAAVALDVHTGEVLALVSKPSFDPALFARGISGQAWVELLQNPSHPLQNKAIKGQYPPGSTFKIVTALAALQAGTATPSTTVYCSGSFKLGSREFRCWKKHGHGRTDLKKALKESCDVWFYQAGLNTGIERIAETARALGLGDQVGFPLDGEKGGLVPDNAWKRRRFGEKWYDGETVIAAIGQGYVLTTPIQLAVMSAAVANGGKVLRPWLVKRVEDLDGNALFEPSPVKTETSVFSTPGLQAVQRALDAVVNEPGGTAFGSRLEKIRFAGKTGTAQVVRLKEEDRGRKDLEKIPYRFRDHALFVAYAPADKPQIAVAVVVEHGSHGSTAAAPIAKAIFASYFGLMESQAEKSFVELQQNSPAEIGD